MKTKAAKTCPLSPASLMTSLQARFDKLKEIQDKIAAAKQLYREHDAIMGELLPLFIEVYPDRIVTKREITVGTKVYRFTPFFYDEKKGEVLTKIWKSTCHEAGRIGQ
jgi:hypothetical protein